MPFIIWKENELSLRIEKMDREHRSLIDTMNRLYDANEAGAMKRDLEFIIEDLVSRVVTHFAHEEEFLNSVSYPRLGLHRSVHKRLLTRLHEYFDLFEKGDGKVSEEFFGFLSIWLTSHIMGNDRDYANYVEEWKKQRVS